MGSSRGRKSKGSGRKRRIEFRRLGRNWALSMLYADEFGSDDITSTFPELVDRMDESDSAWSFARELHAGVGEHGGHIDDRIQESSPRWKIKRMDIIDRNILRLASFELFYRPDVPPRVVINEAVELAKRYGATTTRSFVNGILQQICIDNQISLED